MGSLRATGVAAAGGKLSSLCVAMQLRGHSNMLKSRH